MAPFVIAHYRITSKLGEGGMGAVYRATDTKLNRDVAVKVLPESFANDPDRLARFTREAQVLAALNHPHIAAIYGVENTAFVMELVEGESLRQILERGPVTTETALEYAAQIAEALEAAHERGIVHRDLKPANIMVTPSGVVKVLDFGLAAVMNDPTAASADRANSPTLTMKATQAGVILGTAGYMSPEQARGKPVDKRTDIWAFGVVLYEMITGKRLFEGEDLTETLASVVKDKPDLSSVPMRVRGLIERCLEKDPKRRLRDIGDIPLLLSAVPAPVSAQAAKKSGKLPWIAAAVLAAALGVALWAAWRSQKTADRPLVRLDVDLGADVSLPGLVPGGINVVLSPDGTRLAYSSGMPPKLFIRRLDQPNATLLSSIEGSALPFFSPDGQWVAFRSGEKMDKVSVEGGAVVEAGSVGTGNYAGACWSDDGNIIMSEAAGRGLISIPAAGGAIKTLVPLASDEFALGLPQMLPGGKAVLFVQVTAFEPDKVNIQVLRLADGHRTTLVRGGSSPRYVATPGGDYLLYENKETLFAIPFNLDRLETRGTAIAILNDVAYDPFVGTGQFDFSPAPQGHGTLVYRRSRGNSSQLVTLNWVDSAGKREPLRAKPGNYHALSISPDGKKMALSIMGGDGAGIWIYDLARETMTRLTFEQGTYDAPVWTPDGRFIVFSAFGVGIQYARADGAVRPHVLVESKAILDPAAFAPDGKVLAYNEIKGGRTQIWTVPVQDAGSQLKAGKAEAFQGDGFRSADGISPDGRWLAYTSSESGKLEVYVRAFPLSPGQGGKWQISNGDGRESFWAHNGHDLLYRSGDRIMAARYSARGDTFAAETPRVWLDHFSGIAWTLARDDKRALVFAPIESAETSKPDHEVVFLLNFLDELRRRVPAGK